MILCIILTKASLVHWLGSSSWVKLHCSSEQMSAVLKNYCFSRKDAFSNSTPSCHMERQAVLPINRLCVRLSINLFLSLSCKVYKLIYSLISLSSTVCKLVYWIYLALKILDKIALNNFVSILPTKDCFVFTTIMFSESNLIYCEKMVSKSKR